MDQTYATIDGWVMPVPEPALQPYAGWNIHNSWTAIQHAETAFGNLNI